MPSEALDVEVMRADDHPHQVAVMAHANCHESQPGLSDRRASGRATGVNRDGEFLDDHHGTGSDLRAVEDFTD